MTLDEMSSVLLAAAAIISLLALISSWLRPRGGEERQLDSTESEIRRKQRELSARQKAGGDERVKQVSSEMEQVRRKIFGELRK